MVASAVAWLGGDQRAFGHGGGADASGDGRGDAGIVQIDAGGIGIGLGLQIGGLGVVGVLGRDGVLLQQLGIAVGLGLGVGQCRQRRCHRPPDRGAGSI